jgi:hypothetical protein
MQRPCYNEAFQEVLTQLEPRTPIMVLHINIDPDRPTAADVRVVLKDSLTCNTLGEYLVNPVDALLLLHRASQFELDAELCEEGDFTVQLYTLVCSRYARDATERCSLHG